MPLSKPYYLTYRPNKKDPNNRNFYMHNPQYVENSSQYVKIAELLYKDFENLFDYIEPSDKNQECYSFRLYELLLRSCTEVEANMKGILVANDYSKKKPNNFSMEDYFYLEKTHHLSEYEVFIPNWSGKFKKRIPYAKWKGKTEWNKEGDNLPTWYDAYNNVKHNRQKQFGQASLGNAIDAYCGLLILLTAQFYDANFANDTRPEVMGDIIKLNEQAEGLGFIRTIGTPFDIKLPRWTLDEHYDFNWDEIKNTDDPYKKLFEEK